ncbi:hypothetical protein C1752_09720 [Acaryochloris thomasi RCC1774]|uniref:Uncharacterized protein n=1 Tax=Acaryochloris thomasi RCC1774 TaxID=1764569 RepID=A0A2W1JI22_9CYAN|nr:hypothetical protein [Acaryochloris thomasi]PZD70742.1 hypothetical protein C1752_09720 [Acaryochloris thomasi RCC1774]
MTVVVTSKKELQSALKRKEPSILIKEPELAKRVNTIMTAKRLTKKVLVNLLVVAGFSVAAATALVLTGGMAGIVGILSGFFGGGAVGSSSTATSVIITKLSADATIASAAATTGTAATTGGGVSAAGIVGGGAVGGLGLFGITAMIKNDYVIDEFEISLGLKIKIKPDRKGKNK